MPKYRIILSLAFAFNLLYSYNNSGLKCGFEDSRCSCGFNNMNKIFLKELKKLEYKMGKSFFITSGSRCNAYNRKVKGGATSQHLKGLAVDIRGKEWTANDKKRFVRYARESNYFTKVLEYTDTKHMHIEYRRGDSFSYLETKKTRRSGGDYADSNGDENYFYYSFVEVSTSLGLNASTNNGEIGFNNGWFIYKPYVKIWDFYYSGGRKYKNFKSKNSYGFMFDYHFDMDELHYTYLIYEEFFATSDNAHYDNNFSFELIDLD